MLSGGVYQLTLVNEIRNQAVPIVKHLNKVKFTLLNDAET